MGKGEYRQNKIRRRGCRSLEEIVKMYLEVWV